MVKHHQTFLTWLFSVHSSQLDHRSDHSMLKIGSHNRSRSRLSVSCCGRQPLATSDSETAGHQWPLPWLQVCSCVSILSEAGGDESVGAAVTKWTPCSPRWTEVNCSDAGRRLWSDQIRGGLYLTKGGEEEVISQSSSSLQNVLADRHGRDTVHCHCQVNCLFDQGRGGGIKIIIWVIILTPHRLVISD